MIGGIIYGHNRQIVNKKQRMSIEPKEKRNVQQGKLESKLKRIKSTKVRILIIMI